MGKFVVMTDASADMPQELAEEMKIEVVPFYIMLGSGSYLRQGDEITNDDFYKWMLRNPEQFPKSSAPSAEDFFLRMRPFAEAGEDILCLCITTKFSSSFQSASIAKAMIAEEYPNVRVEVMDTQVNTVLQGQFVLEACRLRDEGCTMDEALERLLAVRGTGRIFFTIGSLDYLQMGGRIGKLAGKVTGVLGIRPVIVLSEGEIHLGGIGRGRAKSLDKVLDVAKDYLKKNFASVDELSMAVGYGYDYAEALRFHSSVCSLLGELGLDMKPPIRKIGAVIGVHTGPQPLGVGILKKA